MNTIRNENDRAEGAFMRFYDWVNDKLYPILGPADLAPYEPALEQVTTALCPLCHEPMAEHYFDRSAHDVVLYCPQPERVRSDENAPLDEWGRVKRQS